MSKKSVFIAAALIGIFVIAGCQPSAPEPVNIRIEMTEFAFSPDHIELKVGQEVTLTLVNMGGLEHELMMGQTVNTDNGMADGFMVDFFEAGGVNPMVMGSGEVMTNDEMEDMGGMEESGGEEHDDGDEHMEEGEHMAEEDMHMHSGWMVSVPVTQEETTVTFTVTEDMVGEWELGCFLLSGDVPHYDVGMFGTVTVLP